MTTEELELALKQAADAARPPRSVVDDVMARLDTVACPEWERVPHRHGHPRRLILGLVSAAAVVAVAVTLAVVLLGTGASVTLADVKAALAGKTLVHIRFDGGQAKEQWMDLQAGRFAVVRFDGGVRIIDEVQHTMLSYEAYTHVVELEPSAIYPDGTKPEPYAPKTAYDAFVAPLEQQAKSADGQPAVEQHNETVDGHPTVRFDLYTPDGLGHRMLFTQLWVDKSTHLPVRSRTRLQLGERPESGGREWALGTYDFDTPVPPTLADLGVPKDTPVVDRLHPKPVPDEVQKFVAAAKAARDSFPRNYRSVVWRDSEDEIDVIYRQGDKIAQSRYFNIQENARDKEHKYSIPRPLTAARILEWTPTQTPVNASLYDGQREYNRSNPLPYLVDDKPASVHVTNPRGFPLLNDNDWPEETLWPTMLVNRRDFEYLGKTDDAPAGTVVLRTGGAGTQRHDFYVEPANQCACVKWIWWEKRDNQWRRTREYLTSDFRYVKGHPVAATRIIIDYGDESRQISPFITVEHHDTRALKPADYPADIFNGQKLLEGARVEPF